MNRMNRFCIVVFCLLGPLGARAAQTSSAANSSSATAQAEQAMFGVHEIAGVAISPDGQRVAWVESLVGKGGAPSPNSAIFVASWRSPGSRARVTAANGAPAAEGDVAWSLDDKQIAFFSDAGHPGQQQLFVIQPGGTARQITHVKGDLSSPQWSPDGKSIAFLFIENAPRAAGPLAAETPDEGVVTLESYEQRLALVDVATGKMRQISPPDMYVYEYDWSPDGKKLVGTAAQGNGDDNWYVAQLCIFDPAANAPRSIYLPPVTMQIGAPRWSPDGKTIAFIGGLMSDEPIVGGDIYTIPAAGGQLTNATPDMHATASSLDWSQDSKSLIFGEIVDGKSGIAVVSLDSGSISTLWTGAEHVGANHFGIGVSFARDGQTSATVRQSYSAPLKFGPGRLAAGSKLLQTTGISIRPGEKPKACIGPRTSVRCRAGSFIRASSTLPNAILSSWMSMAARLGPTCRIGPRAGTTRPRSRPMAISSFFPILEEVMARGNLLRGPTSRISAMGISRTSWPAWTKPSNHSRSITIA